MPPFLNDPINPIVVEILSLFTVLAARAIEDGRTRACDIPIRNAGIINIVLSNDNDTKKTNVLYIFYNLFLENLRSQIKFLFYNDPYKQKLLSKVI